MSQLKSHDLGDIDKYFQGNDAGYVLDFNNKTFADFFAEYLNIDIDDQTYTKEGTSKAKRLKYFLSIVDDKTALETINAPENYKSNTMFAINPKHTSALLLKIDGIKNRLSGSSAQKNYINIARPQSHDSAKFIDYRSRLNALKSIPPQERGFKFEKYLFDLFKEFHLNPRESFRVVGEQIDGSFELDGETYLIEAKWTSKPIDNQSLGGFHSKIEQKSHWTRGIFISFGGFSTDAISAFGKGRRLVCISGKDIFDCLDKEIPIATMIRKKVRHAAETGDINTPISALI